MNFFKQFVFYRTVVKNRDSLFLVLNKNLCRYLPINEVNVRILKPKSDYRKFMFVRIEEFEQYLIQGELCSDSLAEAIKSIENDIPVVFDEEKLKERIDFSKNWLKIH